MGNGIVAEQKCKRIERRDPDSLRSDPNMENWKETSRNKEIGGNRRKNTEGTDDGTNQKTTERGGTDGNSHRTHGNGREQAGMSRECHGKAGERWRRFEKIRWSSALLQDITWHSPDLAHDLAVGRHCRLDYQSSSLCASPRGVRASLSALDCLTISIALSIWWWESASYFNTPSAFWSHLSFYFTPVYTSYLGKEQH